MKFFLSCSWWAFEALNGGVSTITLLNVPYYFDFNRRFRNQVWFSEHGMFLRSWSYKTGLKNNCSFIQSLQKLETSSSCWFREFSHKQSLTILIFLQGNSNRISLFNHHTKKIPLISLLNPLTKFRTVYNLFEFLFQLFYFKHFCLSERKEIEFLAKVTVCFPRRRTNTEDLLKLFDWIVDLIKINWRQTWQYF